MLRRRMESMYFLIRFIVVATCIVGGHAVAHAQSVGFAEVSGRLSLASCPWWATARLAAWRLTPTGPSSRPSSVTLSRFAMPGAPRWQASRATLPSRASYARFRSVGSTRFWREHVSQNKPLTPDMLYLAGLQRVEYVFAYPELRRSRVGRAGGGMDGR